MQSGLYKSIGPPSASPEESDTGGEASQGGTGDAGDASGEKLGKRRRSIPDGASSRKNGSSDAQAEAAPTGEEDAYNSSSSAKSTASASIHKKPRHSSKAPSSRPRSRSRSAVGGDTEAETGSTLDEGEASLMKDLEDEIVAAMGAEESLDEAEGGAALQTSKNGVAASDTEGETIVATGGFDPTGVRVD